MQSDCHMILWVNGSSVVFQWITNYVMNIQFDTDGFRRCDTSHAKTFGFVQLYSGMIITGGTAKYCSASLCPWDKSTLVSLTCPIHDPGTTDSTTSHIIEPFAHIESRDFVLLSSGNVSCSHFRASCSFSFLENRTEIHKKIKQILTR